MEKGPKVDYQKKRWEGGMETGKRERDGRERETKRGGQ
jgi:hypothetical protein